MDVWNHKIISQDISLDCSIAFLTHEIFWSTLKINFILPHIHVLFYLIYFCLDLT